MENAAGGELFDMICRGKVKINIIVYLIYNNERK